MENKEFGLNNIYEIVDELSEKYHLPEFTVTDGQWQALLDNLRECFKDKGENDCEVAINILIRRTIHDALIEHADKISFYYVILSLKDLVAFSIYETKQIELRNKIMFDALKNNANNEKSKTK